MCGVHGVCGVGVKGWFGVMAWAGVVGCGVCGAGLSSGVPGCGGRWRCDRVVMLPW